MYLKLKKKFNNIKKKNTIKYNHIKSRTTTLPLSVPKNIFAFGFLLNVIDCTFDFKLLCTNVKSSLGRARIDKV